MSNGRILHLAINEKFIDDAFAISENVAPGLNDFLIFFDEDTSYIKRTPHTIVRYRDRLGRALYQKISAYDFVILHSLHPYWISVINRCAADVTFVWLGWGYDYYDLIYSDPAQLLLPATLADQQHIKTASQTKQPFHLIGWFRQQLEKLWLSHNKYQAISKIAFFSPILINEYEIIKQAFSGDKFPQRVEWSYGSLEDAMLNGFVGHRSTGHNILLGNSASATSNHLDALNWLAQQPTVLHDRQLICPLSYGDYAYARRIAEYGKSMFGNQFQALTNYVSRPEYLHIVASCSHLIMNHVRQQGLGIVIIMLYLGTTVFLREECPTYKYLKQNGFHLYTIQQLEANPKLLAEQLTEAERQKNVDLLYRQWSKQAVDEKARVLMADAKSIR
jgi:dTDP-N-acetylfucosamine:lipid II N-acetylfucosaminyltransferase